VFERVGTPSGPRELPEGVRLHGAPPTHLTYAALEALGLPHAFTTRHHGNIEDVSTPGGPFAGTDGPALEALGIPGPAVHVARQVHGTAALVVDEARSGVVGTGDALITTRSRRPLAVFSADCLAVVIADPERPVLAIAHAGWRGTVAGILPRLVRLLVARFDARAERLVALIGPSIGPCCYEVDEPVVGPLGRAFPRDVTRWVRPRAAGKWWLDLWRANADQLAAAGLRPDAIANARLCTACRGDLFYSYRREGPGLRLAALALLP
jgi:purine-nucleoside/S-methyl-5'-thioadenosine phosphorylase / adenosine deaminase